MSEVCEGPCMICHEPTTRYGEHGHPLCQSCQLIVDAERVTRRRP